ncbi:MAG: DUF362 domain-containing protein [Elusimicrobiota bacterium]|jgi:uncharacterized Fe-S center protein|nr:DUF362 domain-containing protein [Elusimicrobiota bacterium]
MSSKVHFLAWDRKDEFLQFLKITKVFSHIKAKNFLAIKIHFGEEGNEGYINHQYTKQVVKIAKEKTAFPFLTDASTIYIGKRSDAYHHLIVAQKHGFSIENCECPIIIADGLRGDSEVSVAINLKHFKSALIARDIARADKFIFMSHFKGHEITGFGGALKNIGMGCASKAGKYAMHHNSKPAIDVKKCKACGICIKHCYQNALSVEDGKIVMDKNKCAGCGQCIATCPSGAFELNWNENPNLVQEKIVEYSAAVLKNKESSYINFLNHISKFCDCFSFNKNKPLMDDVGIIAGTDPVAVDQASYDLVNKIYGKNFFRELYPDIDAEIQLKYAEEIGLGSRKYELVNF